MLEKGGGAQRRRQWHGLSSIDSGCTWLPGATLIGGRSKKQAKLRSLRWVPVDSKSVPTERASHLCLSSMLRVRGERMPEGMIGGRGGIKRSCRPGLGTGLSHSPEATEIVNEGRIGSRGLQRAMKITGRAISDPALLSIMGTKRKGPDVPSSLPEPGPHLKDQVR